MLIPIDYTNSSLESLESHLETTNHLLKQAGDALDCLDANHPALSNLGDTCDKLCDRVSSLKFHIKRRKEDSKEKLYECYRCTPGSEYPIMPEQSGPNLTLCQDCLTE